MSNAGRLSNIGWKNQPKVRKLPPSPKLGKVEVKIDIPGIRPFSVYANNEREAKQKKKKIIERYTKG